MNCNIIKDLIPLSNEGLCSKESEKEINEHIKTCENCRLLYEKTPITPADTPIPSENETFRKVNHKFKKMSVKTWCIGILLTAVLACVGYLSFGQITKMQGTRSFETIAQSFEVRKIARYIANGDFDSYIDSISDGFITDILKFDQIEAAKEISKKNLSETFEKAYGNTKVKKINVKTSYEQMYAQDSYSACSAAEIEFESGQKMLIDFTKNVDGKYIAIGSGFSYDAQGNAEKEFFNAVELANWQEIMPLGLTERLISNSSSSDMYQRRFHKEYREAVKLGKQEFLDKGFTLTNVYFSRRHFDTEKNMFFYELTVEAADNKGTSVMTTRLYHDYLGFYPPEKESIKLHSDNCTPELETALRNFFG